MRKVSLVLLALIVAAGTAFASDVTVSGSVQQAWGFGDGVYSNFDADSAEIDLKFTAVVDEVNTAVIKLENEAVAAGSEDIPEIDESYFDTNLAVAFGLEGVILQTRVGYWETDNFNVSTVTGLELEDVANTGSQESAIQLEVGMTDLVTARFVLVPGQGDEMDGLIAIKGGAGPVMAEFYYTDGNGMAPDGGTIGLGVMFSQEVVPATVDLSVGADLKYQLDAADGASDIFYGFGVSAGLLDGLSTVGVSMQGESEAALAGVGVDINVAPVAFAGLDFVVAMGLDSDMYDESLQYLEASAYLKPGDATFRLGYAYYDGTTDAGTLYSDYNAGGFIAGAESGFMFLNTKLSF